MKRLRLAAALVAGASSAGPSLAQQSKVCDWTIEKRSQDTHCNASRGYKDDSIEMQIPRAGEALAALKFCEENRK